jgi:hypothetical protein
MKAPALAAPRSGWLGLALLTILGCENPSGVFPSGLQAIVELVPGSLLAEEQTAAFRGPDSLDLVSDCFDCHGVWSFVRVRD